MIYAWVTRPQTSSAAKLPLLAKTEVWLIFWLGVLFLLAVSMMLKALNSRKAEEGKEPEKTLVSRSIVITSVTLLAYFWALPKIGFCIPSFVLLMVLMTLLSWGMDKITRDTWVKYLMLELFVSVATVAATYALFTLVLNQMLPRGLWI